MSVCDQIRDEIRKRRYNITYDHEDENRCLINFRDEQLFRKAKEKYGEDDALFIATSTAEYDKKKNSIATNLVAPLEKFCELYLEECCVKENQEPVNVCRIHVDPEYPKVGLEVKPINLERFKQALDDFMNCTK
ncbi:MAG: hypothetical protein ACTSSA_12550 [Candidatus Freyarchaeota archaeon]